MRDKVLVGNTIELIFKFYSRNTTNLIDVMNPVFKVYDYNFLQIGTDLDVTGNRVAVGTYIVEFTVPNLQPHLYVAIEALNEGLTDVKRDKIETVFSYDDINTGISPNLIVNTNTYATLEEAETIANEIYLYANTWLSATTDDKRRALMEATIHIDTLKYRGFRESITQQLAFPRTAYANYYFNPFPVIIPVFDIEVVKKAQVYEAMAIISNTFAIRESLQAQGITNYRIGDNQETFKPINRSVYSSEALRLLKKYISNTAKIV